MADNISDSDIEDIINDSEKSPISKKQISMIIVIFSFMIIFGLLSAQLSGIVNLLSTEDDKILNKNFEDNKLIENPSVNAYADIYKGKAPLDVSFYYDARDINGFINETWWYFDDGDLSTEQNPSHCYEKEGLYNVTLIIIDDNGNQIKDTMKIEVEPRDFILSGKISNNYNKNIEIDVFACEGVFNSEDFLDDKYYQTISVDSYSEKEYTQILQGGNSIYTMWAQAYSPGTLNTLGKLEIIDFTNPQNEDITYNINIDSNGQCKISTNYNPPYKPPEKPKPDELVILSHNANRNSRDFFAQIYNGFAFPVKDVWVRIVIYDASNNIIKDTTTLPIKDIIGSGDKTTWHYNNVYIDYFDHYEIKIKSYEESFEEPYDGLEITSTLKTKTNRYWSDILNEYRTYTSQYITGTIKNTGSEIIKYPNVNLIIYDNADEIIYIGQDSIFTIYSGETKNFEFNYIPDLFSYYEIEIG